jgi:hypothetical protein
MMYTIGFNAKHDEQTGKEFMSSLVEKSSADDEVDLCIHFEKYKGIVRCSDVDCDIEPTSMLDPNPLFRLDSKNGNYVVTLNGWKKISRSRVGDNFLKSPCKNIKLKAGWYLDLDNHYQQMVYENNLGDWEGVIKGLVSRFPENVYCLVATHRGKFVGWCVVYRYADMTKYRLHYWTDYNYRRKGISKFLTLQMIQRLPNVIEDVKIAEFLSSIGPDCNMSMGYWVDAMLEANNYKTNNHFTKVS